jgi:hypothetical protein
MTNRETLKRDILECLEGASTDGELGEAEFGRLQGLIEKLEAEAPYVASERQDLIAGNWDTAFASFGAKHSAGKSRAHLSNLAIQSFNHLPSAPIRVLDIRQEIDPASAVYSNVIILEGENGGPGGLLIIHGNYTLNAEHKQRFNVAFHRAELRPSGNASLPELKQSLGLPEDAATDVTFKPPKLWSDITFVDESVRINKGNFGGVYVTTRSEHPMISVPA